MVVTSARLLAVAALVAASGWATAGPAAADTGPDPQPHATVVTPFTRPGLTRPAAASLAPALAIDRTGPVTVTPGGARLFACAAAPDGLCGTLRVPLDRTLPGGAKVRLFFLYYPHRDPGPSREAIMLSEGGPGYSVTETQFEAPYYRQTFDPLLDHRDLVMLDQRGVGRSGVIDCPELQADGDFASKGIVHRVALCARQLGDAASLYGSGSVALDMEAVRHALGIRTLDLYGGSYAAQDVQSYAVRFPGHVRAAVLDSPFVASAFDAPGGRFDDFLSDLSDAVPAVADLTCARSGSCSAERANAHDALAWLTQRLRTQPLTGVGYDATGVAHQVTVTESSLAWTILQADDFGRTALSEIAAAADSLRAGDPVPLLRLGAEADAAAQPGDPDPAEVFSNGDNVARSCTDLDFPWDKQASVSTRREQWTQARDALPTDWFGLFSKPAWLQRPPSPVAPDPCIVWPAPRHHVPAAIPPGASFPGSVPALVITGDTDLSVPPADSRPLVDLWPNSHYVEIENANHHTFFSAPSCADPIIVRFFATLDPGDTSCAETNPQEYSFPAVGRFPLAAADAAPATPTSGSDRSTTLDRQVATVSAAAVTDAYRRGFGAAGGPTGVGLRGGTFSLGFDFDNRVADLDLDGARFAADTAVTGHAGYGFDSQTIDASVTVDGPGAEDGDLRVTGAWYGFQVPTTVLAITGTIGGRDVDLEVPAS